MAKIESGDKGYAAHNTETNAIGKYQYVWKWHGKDIMEKTGVKSAEEFKNNPAAQEKYHSIVTKQYENDLPDLQNAFGKDSDPRLLMALNHFLGKGDAMTYLRVLSDTNDYDKAQEAVDNNLIKRNGYLPKNQPVAKYLHDFNIHLNK